MTAGIQLISTSKRPAYVTRATPILAPMLASAYVPDVVSPASPDASQAGSAINGTSNPPSGLAAALGAYLIWGFLPLYLMLVTEVPALEFVGWRVIWTLPFCLAIVAVRGQFKALWEALRSQQAMLALLVSATLIAGNWLVYIWAITKGEVYAASLGYYLNPLLNVLLGTALLEERLSKLQWLAVAIAASAVCLLAAGALTSLWISLSLALSFGLYGIVRKQVSVGSLPGLTIETFILLLPAIAITASHAASPAGASFGREAGLSLAIAFSGFVTAVPLLLFALAARRMAYSTLGFIQYLAPTIVFLLGLTVFDEELEPIQLTSFLLIWTAVAIFIADLWSRTRQAKAAA